MATVADLVATKPQALHSVDAGATVIDAVRAMVAANVGSLLVTEDGEITGIVTERDYLRRVTLEGRDEQTTAVRDIMSSPLVVVTPDTTLEEMVERLAAERDVRVVWTTVWKFLDRHDQTHKKRPPMPASKSVPT